VLLLTAQRSSPRPRPEATPQLPLPFTPLLPRTGVLRCAVDGTFELTPEQLEAWRGASSRGGGFFELAGSRRPAAAAAASRVGSLSPTVLPLNGAGAASQDGGDEPDKPGE